MASKASKTSRLSRTSRAAAARAEEVQETLPKRSKSRGAKTKTTSKNKKGPAPPGERGAWMLVAPTPMPRGVLTLDQTVHCWCGKKMGVAHVAQCPGTKVQALATQALFHTLLTTEKQCAEFNPGEEVVMTRPKTPAMFPAGWLHTYHECSRETPEVSTMEAVINAENHRWTKGEATVWDLALTHKLKGGEASTFDMNKVADARVHNKMPWMPPSSSLWSITWI